ncbi:hypothetical protein D3C81_1705290 [compost metagenome]
MTHGDKTPIDVLTQQTPVGILIGFMVVEGKVTEAQRQPIPAIQHALLDALRHLSVHTAKKLVILQYGRTGLVIIRKAGKHQSPLGRAQLQSLLESV